MILLELFIGFLQVGFFSFGGAYAAIPLIRDVVVSYGWIDDEMLAYMIAVSESTPGPIMINLATYVGSDQAGFLGALIATFAVILPSFILILVIVAILRSIMKNPWLQAALGSMKPSVIGIILATGVLFIVEACFGGGADTVTMIKNIGLTAVLFGLIPLSKRIRKKKITPIQIIVIAAVAGIIIF